MGNGNPARIPRLLGLLPRPDWFKLKARHLTAKDHTNPKNFAFEKEKHAARICLTLVLIILFSLLLELLMGLLNSSQHFFYKLRRILDIHIPPADPQAHYCSHLSRRPRRLPHCSPFAPRGETRRHCHGQAVLEEEHYTRSRYRSWDPLRSLDLDHSQERLHSHRCHRTQQWRNDQREQRQRLRANCGRHRCRCRL